jgi:hypothetical protein
VNRFRGPTWLDYRKPSSPIRLKPFEPLPMPHSDSCQTWTKSMMSRVRNDWQPKMEAFLVLANYNLVRAFQARM